MPDRLNDIGNVLDYGADPTGANDSWAAINACMSRLEFQLIVTGTPTTSGGIDTIPIGGGVPAFILNNAGRYFYQGQDLTNLARMPDGQMVPSLNTSTSLAFDSTAVPISNVQVGDTIRLYVLSLGTIYFPPGNYRVTQSIDFFKDVNTQVTYKGVGAASTIFGSFADYIFRCTDNANTGDNSGSGGMHLIESLNVINNDPGGGGIRIGFSVGGAVRDCTFSANRCINTASDDTVHGVTSQELSIENCFCFPGSHVSGSVGILSVADGPITNCTIIGFENGARIWGGQGNMTFQGCRFELCGIGLNAGIDGDGLGNECSYYQLSGCSFKDCGTAISATGTTAFFMGIDIESTGAAVFGSVPQYGIVVDTSLSMYFGIVVNGPYAVAGISIATSNIELSRNAYMGINVNNTAGGGAVNWILPSRPVGALIGEAGSFNTVVGCNAAPSYNATTSLPVASMAITGTSWADGTAIFTLSIFSSVNQGVLFDMVVTGAPTGYNGTFINCIAESVNQIAALIPSMPSGSGGGGTVLVNPTNTGFSSTLIISASWSSGVATVTFYVQSQLEAAFTDTSANVNITNVPITGYNGAHMGASFVTYTINSYTYNSSTGLVTLTMAASVPFGPNSAAAVTGLNIAGLNGPAGLIIPTGGTTVSYIGPTGLIGTPSGGGVITQANQLSFPLASRSRRKLRRRVFQRVDHRQYIDHSEWSRWHDQHRGQSYLDRRSRV